MDLVWIQAGFQSDNALNILDKAASAANEVMMPPLGELVERASGADISHHDQSVGRQGPHHVVHGTTWQRSATGI